MRFTFLLVTMEANTMEGTFTGMGGVRCSGERRLEGGGWLGAWEGGEGVGGHKTSLLQNQ